MRIKQVVHLFLASAIALPLLTSSAAAGPFGPVTVVPAPEGQGAIDSPGVRLVADLPANYVEEEYFISGTGVTFEFCVDEFKWALRQCSAEGFATSIEIS